MQTAVETGTRTPPRKSIPIPLKTALETVEGLSAAAPPELPEAKLPLDLLLMPTPAEIEGRAACNGRDPDAATRSLIAGAKQKLERLRRVSPEVVGEIDGFLRKGWMVLGLAWNQIGQQNEAVASIESKLKQLGELRRDVAADVARLADARKTLEQTSALNLTIEALTALENIRKHMPTRIAANQRQADELLASIVATAKDARIELGAVRARLFEESAPGDLTRSLFNSGYMVE